MVTWGAGESWQPQRSGSRARSARSWHLQRPGHRHGMLWGSCCHGSARARPARNQRRHPGLRSVTAATASGHRYSSTRVRGVIDAFGRGHATPSSIVARGIHTAHTAVIHRSGLSTKHRRDNGRWAPISPAICAAEHVEQVPATNRLKPNKANWPHNLFVND